MLGRSYSYMSLTGERITLQEMYLSVLSGNHRKHTYKPGWQMAIA